MGRLIDTLARPFGPAGGMLVPGSSRGPFERPIELAVVVIAVLGLPKLVSDISGHTEFSFGLGLATLVLAHILVAVEAIRPSRLGWVIVGLTAVATAIIVIGQLLDATHGHGYWRIDAWYGTVLVFGILLRPKGRELLALAIIPVIGGIPVVLLKDLDWREQLLAGLYMVASLGLVWLARLVTLSMVREYLASEQLRQKQVVKADETAARTEALAALRRDMHDSLLHTLQRMGASWSSAGPDEIRASCGEARERLASAPGPAPDDIAVDICAPLGEVLGPLVSAIICDQPEIRAPKSVMQALVGAAREAARNSIKHAGEKPTLRIVRRGERIRLVVSDAGPGFDPRTEPRGSLGLRESVMARMAAVGGAARIDSRNGGTTVDLVWPAPPEVPEEIGQRTRRILSWAPAPMLLASVIHMFVIGWFETAWRLPLWVGLVALILVAAVRVRRARLEAWQAVLLITAGLAAFGYNYLKVAGFNGSAWDLWAPTLLACLLVLSLPGQRVRVALTLAGAALVVSVGISVATLGLWATLHSHVGAVLAVVLNSCVTIVLAFGAAGVSRHTYVIRRLASSAAERVRNAQVREAVWGEWLVRAEALTAGFLEEIADGRRDPMSAETRATAARLGARVRDELRLWPGPLDLAEEMDRLRSLGWDARLLSSISGAEVPHEAVGLLRILGPAPAERSQVLVAVEHGRATATITPAMDPDEHPALRPWLSISDPDFIQLRTSGREPSHAERG